MTGSLRAMFSVFAAGQHEVRPPSREQDAEEPRDVRQGREDADADPVHVPLGGQVRREPREEEDERRVDRVLSDAEPPHLTMTEQRANLAQVEPGRRRPAHVSPAGGHMCQFGSTHGWMIGGIAILPGEHERGGHADASRGAEQRAPAEAVQNPEQHRAHEAQADVLGSRVDANRAPALAAWKPLRDDVAVGGKTGRFGEAEREAQAQERRKPGRGRVQERRERPGQQRERVDGARAESIEQDARRHLTEEIRPRERREHDAHHGRAQRELLLDRRRRDPQHGAIQVVDRDRHRDEGEDSDTRAHRFRPGAASNDSKTPRILAASACRPVNNRNASAAWNTAIPPPSSVRHPSCLATRSSSVSRGK